MTRPVNNGIFGGGMRLTSSGAAGVASGGGANSIDQLLDVSLNPTPVDNDVLAFDSSTNQWRPESLSSLGLASDNKVKVVASDTDSAFLLDKLVAGSYINFSVLDTIAGKKILISADPSNGGGGNTEYGGDYDYGTYDDPNADAAPVNYGSLSSPTSEPDLDFGTII